MLYRKDLWQIEYICDKCKSVFIPVGTVNMQEVKRCECGGTVKPRIVVEGNA